nr:speckle-type POZ protein-like isoform X2 [Parasteatoda tepidariorum]
MAFLCTPMCACASVLTLCECTKQLYVADPQCSQKMFEHKLEEKETNVIEIVDLEMQVLKDLISFLYTAFIPNEDFDSVLALYYAADKYDVSDLRKFCGEILLSKLTIDNACLVLALAERHSDQILKDSVMTFMDINLEPILATDEWANLVSENTKLAAEVMRTRSKNKTDVEINVNEIAQINVTETAELFGEPILSGRNQWEECLEVRGQVY